MAGIKRKSLLYLPFLLLFFITTVLTGTAYDGREKDVARKILRNQFLKREYLNPTLTCVMKKVSEELEKVPTGSLPEVKRMASLGDILEISDYVSICSMNTVIKKKEEIERDFNTEDYVSVLNGLEALVYLQAKKRLVVYSRDGIKII
ncbi:hypothetical protein [Desulfurobacterium sp.]|uniref:hypothetical protein n=1 Tax=Desulfurobacterium sp. TaxID=2004706 RepID=UPI0026110A8F|nr:hypothetical protein [Desulfurobacterium sp.]